MDFSPSVPEHKGFGPTTPGQKGFRPTSLRRKDSALAALGHKDFGLVVHGKKEVEPVSLGHKDFALAAAGLGLGLSLVMVDPVDMSIRVVATWVDIVATRANLAAVKDVPAAAEVELVKA